MVATRFQAAARCFRIGPSGNERVLYSFRGGPSDGATPAFWSPLVYANGALYGVTDQGGADNAGTLFKVTLSRKERVVYSFKGNSSESHPRSIVFAHAAFYGGSLGAGVYGSNHGSIFKVTLSGKKSTLYEFKDFPDAAYPSGQLVPVGKTFFGVSLGGGVNRCGSSGCGTVFEVTVDGKEKVLHRFDPRKKDGALPYSGMIYLNGFLYGTAVSEGPHGDGIAFKMSTSGEEVVLHSFDFYDKNGTFPDGSLTAIGHVLYGTTSYG
jgi:uncharacterized repeat protein (TIGR03803 family)